MLAGSRVTEASACVLPMNGLGTGKEGRRRGGGVGRNLCERLRVGQKREVGCQAMRVKLMISFRNAGFVSHKTSMSDNEKRCVICIGKLRGPTTEVCVCVDGGVS